MAKIQLKMSPSLTSVLTKQRSNWLMIEKEIEEGATIRDVLVDVAPRYENFHDMVFNPNTGEFSSQVMIVLNDSLLRVSDVAEARLYNGDTIVLTFAFSGG